MDNIDIVEILKLEFMQRAIIGGFVVAMITAMIGVFVTLRKEAFIGDGISHASLAGIALGFFISVAPFWMAVAVAVFMAVGITFLQKRSTLSSDSIIGVFFTLLFALGIVIFNLTPGYRPEISTYLFGSILSITWADIFYAFGVAFLVILSFALFYRQFLYTTLDSEAAYLRNVKVRLMNYLIRILTAIVIVVSIKVVGVILVSALLIIPASAVKLIAKNFGQMIPLTVTFSIFGTMIGLFMSYILNLPSGATIVLVFGIIFMVVFLLKGIPRD
ncbi:metal ABC transporter permease [Candidatus Dojkabacteria bacterium]|nr:metal ABC transporter permease [Candidatus Dojkabacteria bacterium]